MKYDFLYFSLASRNVFIPPKTPKTCSFSAYDYRSMSFFSSALCLSDPPKVVSREKKLFFSLPAER